MYLAWNILRSLGCYVNNESIPAKFLIYLCFKAQALEPLQINASLYEGPIYFTFLLSHPLLIKSTNYREHNCHSECNVHCPKAPHCLLHDCNIAYSEIFISSLL